MVAAASATAASDLATTVSGHLGSKGILKVTRLALNSHAQLFIKQTWGDLATHTHRSFGDSLFLVVAQLYILSNSTIIREWEEKKRR